MTETLEEQLQRILSLEDDWDDDGAKRILPKTAEKAKLYLIQMNKLLAEKSLQLGDPHLYPEADGEIGFHWKTRQYELLLGIPEEDKPASYYGDDGARGNKMEGFLKLDNTKI